MTDGGVSPSRPRPSRDVFEGVPEPVPEPEAETTRRAIPEGADEAPVPEAEDESRAEADDTIEDRWEVLSMARELFGPDEELSRDKQNGGG
jgi:hypothetical protein